MPSLPKSEIQTPLFGTLAEPNRISWIMVTIDPAELTSLQVTLMNLRRLGPIHRNRGICGQLYDISERLGLEVRPSMWLFLQLSRHWPNYSGVSDYPVPEHLECEQPTAAGDCYFVTTDKWDGPYGDARRDLMDWMINKLEELINEQ